MNNISIGAASSLASQYTEPKTAQKPVLTLAKFLVPIGEWGLAEDTPPPSPCPPADDLQKHTFSHLSSLINEEKSSSPLLRTEPLIHDKDISHPELAKDLAKEIATKQMIALVPPLLAPHRNFLVGKLPTNGGGFSNRLIPQSSAILRSNGTINPPSLVDEVPPNWTVVNRKKQQVKKIKEIGTQQLKTPRKKESTSLIPSQDNILRFYPKSMEYKALVKAKTPSPALLAHAAGAEITPQFFHEQKPQASSFHAQKPQGSFPTVEANIQKEDTPQTSEKVEPIKPQHRVEFEGGYYVGGLRNNLYHGKGTEIISGKSEYAGGWSNGEKQGQGKMSTCVGTPLNQLFYEGGFSENKFNGKGKLVVKKFEEDSFLYKELIYTGQFRADHTHGKGTRKIWVKSTNDETYCMESSTYTGSWAHGLMEGFGRISWREGAGFYEGQWLKGFPNGLGKCMFKGIIYEGEWKMGVLHKEDKESHRVFTFDIRENFIQE